MDPNDAPHVMEAEAVHVLVNEAAERLGALGVDRDRMERLAHTYLSGHPEPDVDAFVEWARSEAATTP